jgi:hypothetical protein
VQQPAGGGLFLKLNLRGVTYDVTTTAPIAYSASNALPSSGTMSIAYSSTTCTPLVFSYLPQGQFSVACGGHTVTKKWTDADTVTALNSL